MSPPRVLITRPLGAAEPLAQALHARGYQTVIDPLLEITPLPFVLPPGNFAAILISSANAIPALMGLDKAMSVLTVGQTTRDEVEAAGFTATCIGQTVAEAMRHLANEKKPILYLSGLDITYDLPGTVRVPVYAARQLALKKATITLLSGGGIDWIVLFSRRSAEALAMVAADMAQQDWIAETGLVCLSARTADPVRALSWRSMRIAAEPTQAALLDALG